MLQQIVQEAAHRFAYGSVDMVKIAYQNFVSTFEQRPTVRTIFPLSLAELSAVVSDIVPVRGAFARQEAEAAPLYTVEPSEEEVFAFLLPRLASILCTTHCSKPRHPNIRPVW